MAILEQLRPMIGSEIGVSDWVVIEQERIQQFADATDDQQWIHVDPEKAAAGPFGGTIAHGFLTLSLVAQHAPMPAVEGVAMAINYGLDRVRFITPVPAGGRVRFRTKITSAAEISGGVQVKTEVTVDLEGSEKPACVCELLVRLYE